MSLRLWKLLRTLQRKSTIDPALKRAYPGLPDCLLKRHSALLSLALGEETHG